jgi:hypothetical protein
MINSNDKYTASIVNDFEKHVHIIQLKYKFDAIQHYIFEDTNIFFL